MKLVVLSYSHHGRSLGRTAAGLGHDIAGIMMAEHLETFIERSRSAERQLPRYVERELRAYLEELLSGYDGEGPCIQVRVSDDVETAQAEGVLGNCTLALHLPHDLPLKDRSAGLKYDWHR